MGFYTLRLEKDLPAALQAKYDLVLRTNAVHATSHITRSCERIRLMLSTGSILSLDCYLIVVSKRRKKLSLTTILYIGWLASKCRVRFLPIDHSFDEGVDQVTDWNRL